MPAIVVFTLFFGSEMFFQCNDLCLIRVVSLTFFQPDAISFINTWCMYYITAYRYHSLQYYTQYLAWPQITSYMTVLDNITWEVVTSDGR